MQIQKLRILLLITFTVISFFCFGQAASHSTTYLILDSADIKNYSDVNTSSFSYYKDQIISSKIFYALPQKKMHYEFVRLDKEKYYYTEFDTSGNRLQEGVAVKETKPFQIYEIPVYNDNGEQVGAKKFLSFKYIKDEKWVEYDSANWNYKTGIYKKGMKEGKWLVVKNRDEVEYSLSYLNGSLIKTEKINLAGTNNNEVSKSLINKWVIISFSTTNRQKFIASTKAVIDYFQLNSDSSCIWHFRGGVHGNSGPQKGTWELFDSNSKIKLTLKNRKIEARIIYLSKYGLSLIFNN